MKTWQPMRVDVVGDVREVVMGDSKLSGLKGGEWEWRSWFW